MLGNAAVEIWGNGSDNFITLGSPEDFLYGNDIIALFGGADTIAGGAGNDTIFGGTDNDSIEGSTGDDILLAAQATISFSVVKIMMR